MATHSSAEKIVVKANTVLASTANLLRSHGWSAGGSYEPGGTNFGVLVNWNKSTNYQKAIALFASKLVQ